MDVIDRLKTIFGSQRALADAMGVGESAVSVWRVRGMPAAQKWRLLEIARARRLPIEPEHLGLATRNVRQISASSGSGHV